ncbi:hypothetical protein Tco_0641103 [Tanacetum coccineum]
MVKDGKIKIDKFTGHEFGFWKMQIEDYLYQKKLHEPLAKVKRTGMKAEDWTLLDRQALDHVNEFNSILSRLISDDIKFDDEVQALLLLSSFPLAGSRNCLNNS